MSDTAAARPPWPIETIERRPVAQLIPYARNARKHTAKQIATIAASIREFGWTMPVLIDEADLIIAGHGRVLAAPQLDLIEVPVIVARVGARSPPRLILYPYWAALVQNWRIATISSGTI